VGHPLYGGGGVAWRAWQAPAILGGTLWAALLSLLGTPLAARLSGVRPSLGACVRACVRAGGRGQPCPMHAAGPCRACRAC
jgi:hypothetical protein